MILDDITFTFACLNSSNDVLHNNNNNVDIGEVIIKVNLAYKITSNYALAGEIVLNTAQCIELGTGKNVLKLKEFLQNSYLMKPFLPTLF